MIAAAAVVGVWPLCPKRHEEHGHLPHELHEFVYVPSPVWVVSGGMAAGDVPTNWLASNSLDAANEAIRLRYQSQLTVRSTFLDE